MHTKYVDPSNYAEEKSHIDEMSKMMPGMAKCCDVIAVDMNHAYVPMEVTQASKSGKKDIEMSAKLTNVRFGL